MKKVLTAIVVLGIIALLCGSVFAGSKTMVVRAYVPGVWDLQWLNTTSNFGTLATNDLGNTSYGLPWKYGTPLKFYIRTNKDYQIQFGNDIEHLRTDFDNLGGGQNPNVNDNRYTPSSLGARYNTGSDGHTNAVIQTQYQVDVTMTWYDNGKKDGPHSGTPLAYTDADQLKNKFVDDMGSGPNVILPSSAWNAPGTLYNSHWTGGAKGTFHIRPRIRPLGIGQQPGSYVGDFTFTVAPHQWNGWT